MSPKIDPWDTPCLIFSQVDCYDLRLLFVIFHLSKTLSNCKIFLLLCKMAARLLGLRVQIPPGV